MKAQRIWAGDLEQKPLLLCEIYPFVRRRSKQGQHGAICQAKLSAILGQNLTFAGSTLLSNKYASETFFPALKPLFEEGIIVPDLRREAHSFGHLSELRARQGLPAGSPQVAEALDRSVAKTILFTPVDVSQDFLDRLVRFTQTRARASKVPADADRAQEVIRRLDSYEGPIVLEDAQEIGKELSFAVAYRRMCDYLYCSTGAAIVRGEPLLPIQFQEEHLFWQPRPTADRLNYERLATEALFHICSIKMEALHDLSCESVLKLREDSRVVHAVERLGDIASEAAAFAQDAAALRREIELAVLMALQKQEQVIKVGSFTLDNVIDNIGIPASSIIKKGVSFFIDTTLKNRYTGKAIRSPIPLPTFVALLRDALREGVAGAIRNG